MTRTGAGLHTPSTPALHITVAQPLAANGWTTDSKLLGQLVDEGGISSSKLAKIAMPSKDDDARLKSLQQTFAKHDMLQVVGDPTYLQAMAMPTRVDGITQPALFDITAYSAMNNAPAYSAAGINDRQWSAAKARKTYQSALGDSNADITAYAWQGNGNWTLQALTKARQQGYGTVIATHDFEEDDAATVRTGKTVVSTTPGTSPCFPRRMCFPAWPKARRPVTMPTPTAREPRPADWRDSSRKARSTRWNSLMRNATCWSV